MKTKGENLKLHYARIICNEIYCFKERPGLESDKAAQHLLMHSLVGTYIVENPPELHFTTEQSE